MSTNGGNRSSPLGSLLELPAEIQTQIYRHYYAKPWTFYAQDYHFNALQPRKRLPSSSIVNPSINLLLTCRAINEIASPILLASYNNVVSLVAVEKFNEYQEWAVFLSTCQKLLAPATVFHIRLDQAEHFSGWDLLHELQTMENRNFKTVVMEDYFLVKRSKPVYGEPQEPPPLKLPHRFLKKVLIGRYLSADPWGMDTWRRDYNSHHLLYPIRHHYLIRFRVGQPDLRDQLFEVELELTTWTNMDMPWKSWLVLREDVCETGSYAEELWPWEIVDLDDLRRDYRDEFLPPITRPPGSARIV